MSEPIYKIQTIGKSLPKPSFDIFEDKIIYNPGTLSGFMRDPQKDIEIPIRQIGSVHIGLTGILSYLTGTYFEVNTKEGAKYKVSFASIGTARLAESIIEKLIRNESINKEKQLIGKENNQTKILTTILLIVLAAFIVFALKGFRI